LARSGGHASAWSGEWSGERIVQGVLIVIGGVVIAAMFFVLYVRAIVAERRAEQLAEKLEELRSGVIGKPGPD
jgi:hypothetical protein